ncbi:hypothetical protein A2Y99_04110 [Candidatus Gottesmanbacteria bacterium RBG_13_37_7]|uniref:Uncharacterized protein n=1 Tax=Candidatus Gottesmanbacteria bacterium RBG_13_37_7 TaxID=1798369 RepID=A0A1F5YHC0_9BACT|nr:MAG: hypothetical protein A2Y99_04110 [Candidatus Gottesmanbacteria bacterium RBG_13_37_7]
MEQHPVPRNINSFQFHLIGDMTLRQFAYLSGGLVLAFIVYKATPLVPVVKYALMGILIFIGVAVAFLPIEERPLDKWLVIFIKSILAPTQYVWRKEGYIPPVLTAPHTQIELLSSSNQTKHNEAKKKLQAYLKTLPVDPHQVLNVKEENYLSHTLALFNTTQFTNHSTVIPIINSSIKTTSMSSAAPGIYQKTPQVSASLSDSITSSSQKIIKEGYEKIQTAAVEQIPPVIKPVIKNVKLNNELTNSKTLPHDKNEMNQLRSQLSSITEEKATLEKELSMLRVQFESITKPAIVKPAPRKDEDRQPTITTASLKTAMDETGIPVFPQAPNIIVGVVKDPQGRILPNIIITIKDKKGLPLRALKTNKLGQFVTATPLSSGIYYLEVEDPLKRYIFDTAELTLEGKTLLPIVIIAKGEKELIREKLAKEIFGNVSI